MVDTVVVSPGPLQVQPGLPTGSLVNGTTVPSLAGRSGELVTTGLHGRSYDAAVAGKVFILTTAVAGTTIPIQATNLASTFTLLNPITSTVNVELIRYSLGINAATTVVADISLYYQAAIGTTNAVLSSTTALTPISAILGGGGSCVSQGFSAATFTNTVGTNFFRACTLSTFGATTTTGDNPIVYEFDGSIIVPPGTAITVAASHAQTQAQCQTLFFAEWPV